MLLLYEREGREKAAYLREFYLNPTFKQGTKKCRSNVTIYLEFLTNGLKFSRANVNYFVAETSNFIAYLPYAFSQMSNADTDIYLLSKKKNKQSAGLLCGDEFELF